MKKCAACLFLLVALAAPVLAQSTDPAAVLADLGSERYDVRERATRKLLTDDTLTPQRIGALYAAATTPEQRCRLMAVAMHHSVRKMVEELNGDADRSSLGILVGGGFRPAQIPEVNRAAVAIREVYPGFPAYAVLQGGDLIVGVDGQSLSDADGPVIQQDFITTIQHHEVGKPMKLSVYRQGETIEVTIRPVSSKALYQLYDAALTANTTGPSLQAQARERWLAFRRELLGSTHPLPPLVVEPVAH